MEKGAGTLDDLSAAQGRKKADGDEKAGGSSRGGGRDWKSPGTKKDGLGLGFFVG